MNMSANILQLHDCSGFYGAEAVILNLSKAMKGTAYNPIVGCIMDGAQSSPALGNAAEQSGLDVEYLPMRMKIDPLIVHRISRLVKQRKVRLVHAHGYKSNLIGLVAATISHVPVVTTNHLFPPMPLDNRRLQFYSRIDAGFTMKRLDRIVAVSDEIRSKLIGRGLDPARISVIKNGIDLDAFGPQEGFQSYNLRRSLNIDDGRFVVGTLGRLTTQKGHAFLLEAAQRLLADGMPVTVLIAGDGFLRPRLEEQARDLGIADQVRFLGYRKDTAGLLRIMDVFVLPSIDEGLPMVMLEAMAARVPVLVTSVGDVPKVIRDNDSGLLVSPGDGALLARGIQRLFRDGTLRDRLADNAFRIVSRFHSKEAMCAGYLSLYDACIAEAGYGRKAFA